MLVRHGQTAWNLEGRAQGHTDVALDDTGRAQAAAVAPHLAAMAPTRIFSSDLARARETAEIVAALAEVAVEIDPRLREFDVGARAGLTVEEFAAAFPDEHTKWRSGHVTGQVPGAESVADVTSRTVAALREIWAGTGADETTVVIGHGAALRVSVLALLDLPEGHLNRFRSLDNCGWVVLEDDPTGAGFRLASYNETGHPAVHGPDFASDSPIR